jgi:serine/threonine-protein kinase
LAATVGHRFGRYELREHIGSGGMGEVYRARDHDLHRDVAIKFLPERFASDASRLERFALEARTASSLNHPNIVTIHEIGQTDGRPYIVMEYVDGATLRRLLQRGRPLGAKQTLDIGAQLADGLAKAHAAHIVHRDLKPENVMVTKDGFVKILDFGLAKLRADREEVLNASVGDGTSETVTDFETAAGVLLGTAAYMAPEQARGVPADYRSDQFALGVTLYEMATGRPAFLRESVVQTLSAIIDAEPQSISEVNPSFPAPARWAIERCLAKDPGDRYASTVDLAHELRGIRDRIGEATTSNVRPTDVAPAPRWPPWLRVLIGVALGLGITILTPAIRERVLRLVHPAPLVGDVRLAVLLDSDSLALLDRERLQSLADYVVIRLAELNRFRQSFSVVPASEVRETQVRSAHDASRRVGANYAIDLTVRRTGQTLVVSASLEDAQRVRVLGGEQRTFAADQFSEEGVVDLILGILPLGLPPDAHSAWASETSGVPEARLLFAKGLNQTTPYQAGTIALVKYDQEQSLQTAIESFNRAIELDPRYADAYARLGEAHLLLYRLTRRPDDLTLAERNATKARDIDDARPAAWITLGMVHTLLRMFAEAEQDFGSAIARAPRSSLAYRELAYMEQQRQNPDRAEANYRKAIDLEPDDWSNYSYLANFLLTARRYSEAEQAWLTASHKAPDNARIWSNLGALYSLERRPDEAEKVLVRAISLYDYAPALSNLGTLRFRAGRYDEAAHLDERAVRASPRDFRLWRYLADVYYWTPGQRDRSVAPRRRAIDLLEEAVKIEPDNAGLLAALADSYATLGDGEKARPLIARAVKLAPSDPEVLNSAASVYENLGDRRAALDSVGASLRAGTNPLFFETSHTFAALVKDPGYARLKSAK